MCREQPAEGEQRAKDAEAAPALAAHPAQLGALRQREKMGGPEGRPEEEGGEIAVSSSSLLFVATAHCAHVRPGPPGPLGCDTDQLAAERVKVFHEAAA